MGETVINFNHPGVIITFLSILVQVMAAAIALPHIRTTGRRSGWALITIAIALIALSNGLSLSETLTSGYYPPITQSVLMLTVSVFLLFGILTIGDYFRNMDMAQKALQAAQSRNDALLNGFPDLIFVLNLEGRFLDYHAADPKQLFLPPDQFLGKCLREVLPEPVVQQLHRGMVKTILTGEVQLQEFELTGSDRPRCFEGRFVRWPSDKLFFLVRDVTETRQMENRLRQSEKMEAIGHLAGGIAHDFNNQLAGIIGYTDLLIERLREPQLLQQAENIMNAAQRASDLTRQLLAFARIRRLNPIQVDVHELIGEVIGFLNRSLDKRIEISRDLSAGPSLIHGDPTQLQNALLNLAINARDAMPQGGMLKFSTEVVAISADCCRLYVGDIQPGTYLQVVTADNGHGMTEEVQRHIFEPFFTTKESGKGTGLGLASVYQTVKNHKGAISVTSEPGKGTTFKLLLPLSKAAKPTDGQHPTVVRGQGRILLVDDEEAIRKVTSDMLTGMGYVVEACSSGAEAMDKYRAAAAPFNLVILDMVMPGMNGRQTFVALQEVNPQVRVLLASGYTLDAEAQATLKAGAVDFLQKPFRQADLSQKVAEVLRTPVPAPETSPVF